MYNIDLSPYKIRTQDDRNIVLVEVRTVRDPNSKNFGQPQERVLGYYGTIDSALKGYVKARMNGPGAEMTSIKEVLLELRAIHQEIDEALAK